MQHARPVNTFYVLALQITIAFNAVFDDKRHRTWVKLKAHPVEENTDSGVNINMGQVDICPGLVV